MKNSIYIYAAVCLLLISCSQDKENLNAGEIKGVTANAQIEKGAVPKDRLVYKVMFTPSDFTMEQIDDMYKNDVASARADYITNLKNMWFVVLNKKLVKEGAEEQKRFYIDEQLKMENNLANINSFYDLLRSSSFTESEKFDLADRFSVKNKAVVDELCSDDAKLKAEKITELTYAKRNFERFASVK